jgi:outer membrane protein assembly factor BamD (BamD/ComL family)
MNIGLKRCLCLMAVLFGLTACAKHPHAEVSTKHPDKVLFERARFAIEQKRFDIAHMTLLTLVNTYPDSKYSEKAEQLLRDPQIARCSGGWSTAPDICNGTVAATPTKH